MNTKTIMYLKIVEKNRKDSEGLFDKKEFQKEWELIKKAQQNG